MTADLNIDDVIDLKEVFDTYERGDGVLSPEGLSLLLAQGGYKLSK